MQSINYASTYFIIPFLSRSCKLRGKAILLRFRKPLLLSWACTPKGLQPAGVRVMGRGAMCFWSFAFFQPGNAGRKPTIRIYKPLAQ